MLWRNKCSSAGQGGVVVGWVLEKSQQSLTTVAMPSLLDALAMVVPGDDGNNTAPKPCVAACMPRVDVMVFLTGC